MSNRAIFKELLAQAFEKSALGRAISFGGFPSVTAGKQYFRSIDPRFTDLARARMGVNLGDTRDAQRDYEQLEGAQNYQHPLAGQLTGDAQKGVPYTKMQELAAEISNRQKEMKELDTHKQQQYEATQKAIADARAAQMNLVNSPWAKARYGHQPTPISHDIDTINSYNPSTSSSFMGGVANLFGAGKDEVTQMNNAVEAANAAKRNYQNYLTNYGSQYKLHADALEAARKSHHQYEQGFTQQHNSILDMQQQEAARRLQERQQRATNQMNQAGAVHNTALNAMGTPAATKPIPQPPAVPAPAAPTAPRIGIPAPFGSPGRPRPIPLGKTSKALLPSPTMDGLVEGAARAMFGNYIKVANAKRVQMGL